MSSEVKNSRKCEVQLTNGERIACADTADAELVLAADRAFYEADPNRRFAKETIMAMERAGLNVSNSVLYRSVMGRVLSE